MKNTKVVKYVEEKKMNKDKKAARSVQRDKKHVAWDDAIVVEDPPQQETKKELEEDFALYKRTCNPKDPLYQKRPELVLKVNVALEEMTLEEITPPHVSSEEGWESDGDGWFD
jgi:hypothetical protein